MGRHGPEDGDGFDIVDLRGVPKTEDSDAAWRMRAISLAFAKHLAGQASLEFAPAHRRDTAYFAVTSASEPLDRHVRISLIDLSSVCDCVAGQHGKPCSHAGAALLLMANYAPERTRDADGFTR